MATLNRVNPKQFIAGAVFQISDERTHLYVTTRMEGAAGGDDIALTGRVALRDAVTACFDDMLTDISAPLVGAVCDHRLDAASFAMSSAHLVHVSEAKWDHRNATREAAFTA